MASAKKVCTDLLREQLSTPITSSHQAWRTLERLATCFVSVANDVVEISTELYGNGTPGGLKVQVANMATDLSRIVEYLKLESGVTYGRRGSDNLSTFDSLVRWIVDKILPSLVISFIVMVSNVILFGLVVMYAVGSGWVVLGGGGAVK